MAVYCREISEREEVPYPNAQRLSSSPDACLGGQFRPIYDVQMSYIDSDELCLQRRTDRWDFSLGQGRGKQVNDTLT